MADWYARHQIGRDLVRVAEPHVDELLSANLWWLRGDDRDIVIDAGLGVVALRDEIPEMFERDPMVVLTHAHLDHVGGAAEFGEQAGHRSEVELLAAGVPASLNGPELYAKLGLTGPAPDLLLNELPYPEYEPAAYRIEPVRVTYALEDRDHIDLGGQDLTVLHLPGHTVGSIVLLEERSGVLYTGDVLYDGELIDDLPGSDGAAYRRSLAFLAGLEVSAVHPGHGPSFDQARMRELARKYLQDH